MTKLKELKAILRIAREGNVTEERREMKIITYERIPEVLEGFPRSKITWGHCKSETCSHHSHSPYTEGWEIDLPAEVMGEDDGDREGERQIVFRLTNTSIWLYRSWSIGFHFLPQHRLLSALEIDIGEVNPSLRKFFPETGDARLRSEVGVARARLRQLEEKFAQPASTSSDVGYITMKPSELQAELRQAYMEGKADAQKSHQRELSEVAYMRATRGDE